MKCIKYLAVTVVILLCSQTTFSQTNTEDDKLSLDSGSIDNQFEYVIKKSGNFKGTNGELYEAVKLNMLLTLKKHTIDSLKTIYKDLADTQLIVDTQSKEISTLKSNLEKTKTDLENTRGEKDNIGLFGAQMSKGSYKTIMWLIIAALLGLLIFFIFKFKSSNSITKDAQKALSDIEEEFEEHRRTALEREQKVRRQLQDEINKQKKTK